jgi:hypothetical protein
MTKKTTKKKSPVKVTTKKEMKPSVSDKVFQAFKKDYQEVCEKHGVGLLASLDFSQGGIMPKLSVAPLKPEDK